MAALIASQLFSDLQERLQLEWVIPPVNAGRSLQRPADHPDNHDDNYPAGRDPLPLVGYLNLIHPNQVQVAGKAEVDYLRKTNPARLPELLEQIFPHNIGMLLIAANQNLPDWLATEFTEARTPAARSPLPGHEIINIIETYLASKLGQREVIHGVLLEVLGAGVLITGASGIGKSELALELVARGHRFIADDCPEFLRISPDTIDGYCPSAVQDFLEVRGLGIVNVRAMFGSSAIKRNKYLRLIINLVPIEQVDLQGLDRLRGTRKKRSILGVEIPEVTLPVTAGRNLAVLVETTVREHLLRLHGYDAALAFEELQSKAMQHNPVLNALPPETDSDPLTYKSMQGADE